MLSFGRQARGRWPCTAALGTAQNRLLRNQARPGIGRPQRIPICRSGQAPCTRPVPGGPGAVLVRAQQGARRTTRVARPARGPAPQRGGCMRRRALPSASNHPAICSGIAGGMEPQRRDCSKGHSIISSTHGHVRMRMHPHPPLAAALAVPRGAPWAGAGVWGGGGRACRPRGPGAMAIGRGVFMAGRGYCCGWRWPAGSGDVL